MLLIHGTAASVAWWNPLLPELADHHDVVRVDLPGHGQSPPAPTYRVTEQAARVAALLDKLGVRQVIVVGHSSGGYVATALAEQRPDLVRGMVLVNVGPNLLAFRPQPTLVRVLSKPPLSRLVWALRSSLIRRGLGTAFTRPVHIPDDLIAAAQGMSYRAFAAAPRESSAYIRQRTVPDRLESLDIPVLVIFGSDDHRWDSSSAHDYDKVPNTHVEMLPGVGHTPMFEAPEVTTKLLLDFADRLEARASSASPPED
jgi:pimeloyl-ACP methyl ester carboxylesterase